MMRLSVWLLALLLCQPRAGFAQEATEAQLLFERGAELYRERRFGEALEAMVASNRLVPNANVVFNVAQIYELLDRPIDAFNWYQRHLGFSLDSSAQARAQERIDKLEPRVAVLGVRADPVGAEVYIDRIELGAVGIAPRRIAVAPGQHLVITRLAGYRDASQAATATIGQSTPVALKLTRLMGRLELVSEPPGAAVFVEGESEALGSTPLAVELPAGVITLVVRLPAHVERRLELTLDDGKPVRHSVQLVRDPGRFATLQVSAEPKGALVHLDGKLAGPAPLTLEGLSPGMRMLQVARAEHEPWSVNLQLIAGSTTHVTAELSADSDKPWPYWHWLGYGLGGALLAGGVSVGVAAYAENQNSADEGSVETLNRTADVLMGAGVVVLAVTLFWHLTADPPPHSSGAVSTRP